MDGILITQTDGAHAPTNTIWLPPQTTPFTPPEYDTQGHYLSCEATVSCQSSGDCWPGYFDSLFPSAVSLESRRPDCFPKGYYEIETYVSVAYQGTACMSGWHSACETTFEHKDRTYSQIWCCPAGEFGCHLREPRIGPDTTWRACTSTVLDPTAYEARTTLSADGMGWGDVGPVSSVVIETTPGERPYLYWVLPIPLQVPAKTTVAGSSLVISTEAIAYSTDSADSGSASGEASSPSAADGTRHLSKGSLAGAISASILAALIAAAMIYACIRRRRRRFQASENTVVDQDQGVDPYYGKPELPTTDITRAELPGGYGMCPEMDGWSRPAEVPTTAGPEAYVKDAVSPEEEEEARRFDAVSPEEEEEAGRFDAAVHELPSPSNGV